MTHDMKISELKQKSKEEMQNVLATSREELRRLRFLSAGGQLKTVRQVRAARRTIAQVLTLLKIKN